MFSCTDLLLWASGCALRECLCCGGKPDTRRAWGAGRRWRWRSNSPSVLRSGAASCWGGCRESDTWGNKETNWSAQYCPRVADEGKTFTATNRKPTIIVLLFIFFTGFTHAHQTDLNTSCNMTSSQKRPMRVLNRARDTVPNCEAGNRSKFILYRASNSCCTTDRALPGTACWPGWPACPGCARCRAGASGRRTGRSGGERAQRRSAGTDPGRRWWSSPPPLSATLKHKKQNNTRDNTWAKSRKRRSIISSHS